MENLDISQTTSHIVNFEKKYSKAPRLLVPKKVKLRPTSKEGIKENLVKFPERIAQGEVTTATMETPQEVTNQISEPKENLVKFPERTVQGEVTTATMETPQDVTNQISAPEVSPVVSETPSNDVVTPDLQPPVVPSGPITQEKKEVPVTKPKVAACTFNMVEGKVSAVANMLPKGLKLKEEKERIMIAQAPEPRFKPVARIEEPEVQMDDGFQTVELKIGEDSEMSEVEVPSMSFKTVGEVGKTNAEENDEMQEIEPTPIGEVAGLGKTEETGMEEIPTSEIKKEFKVSKEEDKKEESEQRKAVVPIYELCEAIDIQREKTREAELKASQLTIDFQKYKEQSQQEIDESYREVKEAGDSQTEAEARYQIAEQEHRSALQNLIDTGKNQQRMLQQRQKEADAQVRAVVQERKALEQTNNTTLAQNKVQLQKYLNHTIELNEQTQIKNEQKAKWEAIAKAMQDPEEDLMGYISPDEIYEVEPDTLTKSYGRRAA